jgi:hypothetical protein
VITTVKKGLNLLLKKSEKFTPAEYESRKLRGIIGLKIRDDPNVSIMDNAHDRAK